jgi:hypothetical protein
MKIVLLKDWRPDAWSPIIKAGEIMHILPANSTNRGGRCVRGHWRISQAYATILIKNHVAEQLQEREEERREAVMLNR